MFLETAILTILVGGGLVISGILLGLRWGFAAGTSKTLNEIFATRLLTPEQLLDYYRKNGLSEYIKQLEAHGKNK